MKLKQYRNEIDTTKKSLSRDSLREIAARLETNLMKRSAEYADIVDYMSVDWQRVKKSLSKKDVAIEFFFADFNLYALVLKKNFVAPKLIELGNTYKIKRIFSQNTAYSTTEIYELVWKPLEQYFSPKGKVYFSPSGALYNIAIEYAPMDDTHLISEKYKIFRISSTRYLRRTTQAKSPLQSSVALSTIWVKATGRI